MQHRDLAAGRCWTLTLAEQLGNIGSEVSRASKWSGRNPELARGRSSGRSNCSISRSTIRRHRQSPPRLRELARAREVVVDFFDGANEYHSTAASLQKYFDGYALAARA